jgi:hypothetical protein
MRSEKKLSGKLIIARDDQTILAPVPRTPEMSQRVFSLNSLYHAVPEIRKNRHPTNSVSDATEYIKSKFKPHLDPGCYVESMTMPSSIREAILKNPFAHLPRAALNLSHSRRGAFRISAGFLCGNYGRNSYARTQVAR